MDVLEILEKRGFINQLTAPDEIRKKLNEETITLYAGYDGTASSLHVGNLVTIMALRHLQKAGHKPIVLVGGGTTRIGDPSGKNETRKILTEEIIDQNAQALKKQLSHYLDFSDDKAIMVNNADWLLKLNYIDFLRDIGSNFSVNRMVTSETYKARLENELPLSFIEFNYQILQAYDFYVLNKDYGCTLEVGGSDQWGNIVAGIDLTRRLSSKQLFGMTFPLVTNADGSKMGKSVDGAIWLGEENFSPYQYYQYWINIDDRDVKKFLLLFTELDLDEIDRLGALEGSELREAKKVLAYEATVITHGVEKAQEAIKQSEVFQNKEGNAPIKEIPTTIISDGGASLLDILCNIGFHSSKGEARRLVQQGGAKINQEKITDIHHKITKEELETGEVLVQSGKKKFAKLKLS